MEERLDAWLKTYRHETTISPVEWGSLPEECRIQLENHARDKAVQRADEFANDGLLDLRRQDAVRHLVDAMAQCWRLPGDEVRRVVEDVYDELPPKPGAEFEQLSTRLFRRRVNALASTLFGEFNAGEAHPVILSSMKFIDLPPNQMLDRSGFLQAFHNAYDAWTMKHPKEAVAELFNTLQFGDESVDLNMLKPFVKKRGARIWLQAMNLEQDIGVEEATPEELVRMLKRYAMMVKRGGFQAIGLSDPKEVPDARDHVRPEDLIGQPMQQDPEPAPAVEDKAVAFDTGYVQDVELEEEPEVSLEEEEPYTEELEQSEPFNTEEEGGFEQAVEDTEVEAETAEAEEAVAEAAEEEDQAEAYAEKEVEEEEVVDQAIEEEFTEQEEDFHALVADENEEEIEVFQDTDEDVKSEEVDSDLEIADEVDDEEGTEELTSDETEDEEYEKKELDAPVSEEIVVDEETEEQFDQEADSDISESEDEEFEEEVSESELVEETDDQDFDEQQDEHSSDDEYPPREPIDSSPGSNKPAMADELKGEADDELDVLIVPEDRRIVDEDPESVEDGYSNDLNSDSETDLEEHRYSFSSEPRPQPFRFKAPDGRQEKPEKQSSKYHESDIVFDPTVRFEGEEPWEWETEPKLIHPFKKKKKKQQEELEEDVVSSEEVDALLQFDPQAYDREEHTSMFDQNSDSDEEYESEEMESMEIDPDSEMELEPAYETPTETNGSYGHKLVLKPVEPHEMVIPPSFYDEDLKRLSTYDRNAIMYLFGVEEEILREAQEEEEQQQLSRFERFERTKQNSTNGSAETFENGYEAPESEEFVIDETAEEEELLDEEPLEEETDTETLEDEISTTRKAGWGSDTENYGRFAQLRAGELRDRVVDELYDSDANEFDAFLDRLSEYNDWSAAKKVIAEELLEHQVNLDEDPGRGLFFALKECVSQNGSE